MKIPQRARAPSHDPKKHAVWTLDALKPEVGHFMTDVFPKTPHEGVFGLPGELFVKSLKDQGARECRFVAYDENFRAMTMPLFPRQVRIRYNKGVRVDYFRYWHDDFRDSKWRDKKVTVRIEPEDAAYVLVLLGTKWVRAKSRSSILCGLSHRDLQVLTEECKAEARRTNRRKRLDPIELECFIARVRQRESELKAAKAAMESPAAESPVAQTHISEAKDYPKPKNLLPMLSPANEPNFDDFDFTPAPAVKVARR